MRDMRGKFAVVIGVLYVAFVVWSLYGAVFPMETHTFRMVHLAFIFGLTFLAHPPARKVGMVAGSFLGDPWGCLRCLCSPRPGSSHPSLHLAGAHGGLFRTRGDRSAARALPASCGHYLHPGGAGVPPGRLFTEPLIGCVASLSSGHKLTFPLISQR
jgi:hypothetical protein